MLPTEATTSSAPHPCGGTAASAHPRYADCTGSPGCRHHRMLGENPPSVHDLAANSTLHNPYHLPHRAQRRAAREESFRVAERLAKKTAEAWVALIKISVVVSHLGCLSGV